MFTLAVIFIIKQNKNINFAPLNMYSCRPQTLQPSYGPGFDAASGGEQGFGGKAEWKKRKRKFWIIIEYAKVAAGHVLFGGKHMILATLIKRACNKLLAEQYYRYTLSNEVR